MDGNLHDNKMTGATNEDSSAQSGQSLLHTQWAAKDLRFLHTDSKDSESLLGAQVILLVLSWSGFVNKAYSNALVNITQCLIG